MRKWKTMLTKDANILLKSLVIEGTIIGPKFVLPKWNGFNNHLWIFKNDEAGIHYLCDELEKFSKVVRNQALTNATFPARYREESKRIIDNSVAEIAILSKQIKSNMTATELNTLFLKFCDHFKKISSTIVMTLEELDKEAGNNLENPHDLITLVTPPELSIEAQEELERIILIQTIQKQLPNIFKLTNQKIKAKLKKYPTLKNKLDQHVLAYKWIPLNFAKPLWNVNFFIDLMRSYICGHINLNARKNELERYSRLQIKAQQKIYSALDDKTKTLCQVLEATSYIRLYRNFMFSRAYFEASPILRAVAHRVNVSLKVLLYFTPREITNALLANKKLPTKTCQNRKKIFVIRILNGNYEQFEGHGAEQIAFAECPPENITEIQLIRGRCAYPGKVQGVVRILRDAREMNRIEPGCVIVCKETNPDIVLAMARAGAIVTDEGGVTSHAAIVSREMKKPCVIGTKIGTKVLKDGDRVVVDAEKGEVRLI